MIMTVLFIVLAVFAFLVSLLFVPLKIKLNLNLEFGKDFISVGTLSFSWLFVKKTFSLDKGKETDNLKPDNATDGKEEPPKKDTGRLKEKLKRIMSFFKGKPAKEICKFFKEILLLLKNFFKALMCHTKFCNLNIKTCFVGEDASKTALYYTRATPLCYSLLSYLKSDPKHFVNPDIQVYAGFLSENSQLAMSTGIKIVPFFALINSVKYGVKFIKIIQSFR